MENSDLKNIITIGASAGGIAAVSQLVATFNHNLDAAVFIVIHVSRSSMTEVILNTIQKSSLLKCVIPEDQAKIENGTVYLAPADHHMLLERGTISITKGAYENHWRPSIDVLFRSAAAAYNACVTGIILTGLLDDGASGMYAIKRCGGICMVQDPEEAAFPDMPNSVLQTMDVDYKVSIGDMGYILSDLFSRAVCVEKQVPAVVKLEADIARRLSSNIEELMELGDLTPMTCPDCGGALAKIGLDAVSRYRCYTGHTFTEKALENEQIKGIEDSLWVAIRMMEERKNLLLNMDRSDTKAQTDQLIQAKKRRVADIQLHVDRLKSMLVTLGGAD
jgi:two-component system chemotaxis response regulator CheB